MLSVDFKGIFIVLFIIAVMVKIRYTIYHGTKLSLQNDKAHQV